MIYINSISILLVNYHHKAKKWKNKLGFMLRLKIVLNRLSYRLVILKKIINIEIG